MTATMKAQTSGIDGRESEPADCRQVIICPITTQPCEGDLAYLCPEYGCA